MADHGTQRVPLHWLFLVYLGYALTCLLYPAATLLGIPVTRGFPMGFIVYGTCTCMAAAILLLALKRRGWTLDYIGFKKPSGKSMLMGLLYWVIGAFVLYPLVMLVNKACGFSFSGMGYTIHNAFDVFVAVFFCALLGPLGEEILFRGILIRIAQHNIANRWMVGALAVVCFAIIHVGYFGVGGMIYITFWAVLPVSLFMCYENICPGYVMHVANNLWAYLVVRLLIQNAG